MRTTLTLDDDLARELQETAHRERKPFKVIVNLTLRRALHSETQNQRFSVTPWESGLCPGVDPYRLNQLSDEMEVDEFMRKHAQAQ